MNKYKFNYKLDSIESDLKETAQYLDSKLMDHFKGYKIAEIRVSLDSNEHIGIKATIEYVSANGLIWSYRAYRSEGERRHTLQCLNDSFSFDWWS